MARFDFIVVDLMNCEKWALLYAGVNSLMIHLFLLE